MRRKSASDVRSQRTVTGIAAGWRVSGTGTSRPQPVRRPNTMKGIVLYSPSCTDCATHPRALTARARHQCGPECLVGCRPRIRPGRNRPTNHRAPVAGRSTHARTHVRCWLRQHQAPQECQDTEAVKANPEVVKANLTVARTRPRASAPGRPRWSEPRDPVSFCMIGCAPPGSIAGVVTT
jgi:hypothetical protein